MYDCVGSGGAIAQTSPMCLCILRSDGDECTLVERVNMWLAGFTCCALGEVALYRGMTFCGACFPWLELATSNAGLA